MMAVARLEGRSYVGLLLLLALKNKEPFAVSTSSTVLGASWSLNAVRSRVKFKLPIWKLSLLVETSGTTVNGPGIMTVIRGEILPESLN